MLCKWHNRMCFQRQSKKYPSTEIKNTIQSAYIIQSAYNRHPYKQTQNQCKLYLFRLHIKSSLNVNLGSQNSIRWIELCIKWDRKRKSIENRKRFVFTQLNNSTFCSVLFLYGYFMFNIAMSNRSLLY